MKPAARDQDIPRGAGIGAPGARETPGGAHGAGRKARRARQRENHRSDPPARLPSPPPPGASSNAAGARFSSTDSTADSLQKPVQQAQREAAAGLSPPSSASVPDPRARLPTLLLPFLPSLLCSRPRASPPALRLRLRRPRPRPLPIPLRLHAHASTYAARQPEAPPSTPFRLSLLDRRTPSLRSWCVSRLVSFAVGINQVGIRLGKLGEGGRPKLEKAGLLDCLRKWRE